MARVDNGSPLAVLVEDDPIQRELVATLLRDIGLTVIECSSAEAAKAVLDRTLGAVALLFVDVRLAGQMTGIELAELARTLHPETSIILTSGRRDVRVPPAARFLPKPWEAADVLAAAEEALTHAELSIGTPGSKAMRDEAWAKLAWRSATQ